ncbi:hypothetical protein AB3S75_043588 [Citrus x aurantiifolia]
MSSSSSSSSLSSSPFNNPEAREALFSKLADKEAEASKHMAEELFKEEKIDSALCVVDRARMQNPNHQGLNSHFACYVVHKLAAEKKSWYAVLGIRDHRAGVDVIKKRYEALVQLFKPDRFSSVGADTANKLINEAWEVLSDPKRREAYDLLMGFDKTVQIQAENQDPEMNVVVKLENQDPEDNNDDKPKPKPKPTLVERFRGNASSPAASSASSSSPSSFLHKTKKVLVVRRNSGQDRGNSGDKIIIITRKPPMKN